VSINFVPQLPQKRKSSGLLKLQFGQTRDNDMPHMPQKRISGGLSNWQLGQITKLSVFRIA
jgi:hypothetical protein